MHYPQRQGITYHGLCYTSSGALVGMRNSSMGPHLLESIVLLNTMLHAIHNISHYTVYLYFGQFIQHFNIFLINDFTCIFLVYNCSKVAAKVSYLII